LTHCAFDKKNTPSSPGSTLTIEIWRSHRSCRKALISYTIMKDDRLPFSAYLLVVSATTVIGALGSSAGGAVAAVFGTVVGLGWGLLVMGLLQRGYK
jgi:hypothetical protein